MSWRFDLEAALTDERSRLVPRGERIRPEQLDVKTVAKRMPIGVQRFPLDHQHRLYGAVELLETLTVDEYLA